jgi:hypothetical protein
MSEYQYYEFHAIDRPLTAQEMGKLREYSSRATITPTRFVVDYAYGHFKGDESGWMERYFDAFLHLANWGTHQLMLRLPLRVLPLEAVQPYCAGESAGVTAKGEHVILDFVSEDDEGEGWIEEDGSVLASLIPLRADLAGGDLRVLYLAWLRCVDDGELGDDVVEPPRPPGLANLSAPLDAFVEFMRIDRDLVAAVAAGSAEPAATENDGDVHRWVAGLPEDEKTVLLLRLVEDDGAHLRAELLRRFRESRKIETPPPGERRRTVGELRKGADARAQERRREEAERAAREEARREREAAEKREWHLATLVKREAEAWQEVDALIATKQPKKYDEAVALLQDLREICVRDGRQEHADARIVRLRNQHAKKPSFLQRMSEAGL